MGKEKGEDLIGQILTAQHQKSHGGFWERNSNLWDDSARSPSPFPSPAPDSRKNLLADYTQVQECAKRPSVDTELLMGVCQRKLRKAKVLSERIGVEESFFCYARMFATACRRYRKRTRNTCLAEPRAARWGMGGRHRTGVASAWSLYSLIYMYQAMLRLLLKKRHTFEILSM